MKENKFENLTNEEKQNISGGASSVAWIDRNLLIHWIGKLFG